MGMVAALADDDPMHQRLRHAFRGGMARNHRIEIAVPFTRLGAIRRPHLHRLMMGNMPPDMMAVMPACHGWLRHGRNRKRKGSTRNEKTHHVTPCCPPT